MLYDVFSKKINTNILHFYRKKNGHLFEIHYE